VVHALNEGVDLCGIQPGHLADDGHPHVLLHGESVAETTFRRGARGIQVAMDRGGRRPGKRGGWRGRVRTRSRTAGRCDGRTALVVRAAGEQREGDKTGHREGLASTRLLVRASVWLHGEIVGRGVGARNTNQFAILVFGIADSQGLLRQAVCANKEVRAAREVPGSQGTLSREADRSRGKAEGMSQSSYRSTPVGSAALGFFLGLAVMTSSYPSART